MKSDSEYITEDLEMMDGGGLKDLFKNKVKNIKNKVKNIKDKANIFSSSKATEEAAEEAAEEATEEAAEEEDLIDKTVEEFMMLHKNIEIELRQMRKIVMEINKQLDLK